MKLSNSGAWKLDVMKLFSILNKIFRGLIASGVFVTVAVVAQNTILPELSPTVAGVVGIFFTQLIEILNKLSKDYSHSNN